MTLSQNFITIIVLLGLFILGYCAIMKKTLTEFLTEIWNLIRGEK